MEDMNILITRIENPIVNSITWQSYLPTSVLCGFDCHESAFLNPKIESQLQAVINPRCEASLGGVPGERHPAPFSVCNRL